MKTMAISAAAFAMLLMRTGPAMAQDAGAQKADHNAVCLIAVTDVVMMAEKRRDTLTEDMKAAVPIFERSIHFHAGALHARYGSAGFDPVMQAAATEFLATPREARAKLSADCAAEGGPVLMSLSRSLAKTVKSD